MSTIPGTYENGKIVLDTSVDWPNGLRVSVSPTSEPIGMTEAEWPTTPEGIESHLRNLTSFEPVKLTPQEEAEWLAQRRSIKQYSIQRMKESWDADQ